MRRTTWKLSAPGPSGQPVRLEANGRVVVDPGFHHVLPPASLADELPAVPDLAAGTVWAPGSAVPEVSSSWTKPPPRYTEASLVAEPASAGVGRPSTYANTLKTLVDRRYVLLDGRVFVVTPLGRLVCARLRQHLPKAQYPPSVPAPEVRGTRAEENHATREPNSPIRRLISRPASRSILLGARVHFPAPI